MFQPWDPTWDGLAREIRLLILKCLMQDGCKLGPLATVSREWQTEIERHNFSRLRLTPSRLVEFTAMTQRNRALVEYIWFCLELDDYDCTTCAPDRGNLTEEEYEEAITISDTDKCPITTGFQDLFSILSTWDLYNDLTLDISIYSPSDSEHWFQYLTFMPDVPLDTPGDYCLEKMILNRDHHDPQHGWVAGFRHSAPPRSAVFRVFNEVMEVGPFDSYQSELQWWDQLPSVPAVTSLLFRQQSRRRWNPTSLARLFSRFPRLQTVCYEPWREWDSFQRRTDRSYQNLFKSIQQCNGSLKRLVVFENFNQQYPATMQRFLWGEELSGCNSIRNPDPAVSQMVALASLKLEHLAASFIADASYFLGIDPTWEWTNLTSLVLTSKLLMPDENPTEIGAMLRAAAAAAMKMPRLETMEIWNGRKGLAALFRYQAFRNVQQAEIVWKGTWRFIVETSIIRAWEAEQLDEAAIESHGDALHYLKLSSQAIRPISLQQIRMEQKALEGVDTIQ
ncbi:hypothetical protein LX32DRAFT_705567 [Colletotrichum zoysiae]|uniref:DUF6546 domain-containing protein n=1 Tax=Colletotrichum zoysiae TaxID=1216348 RepID=A0AAD9H8Y2_9PEZI|nr:hypothetical protein LX32DRAFT_705567 [Colletotrichum zoysiae]